MAAFTPARAVGWSIGELSRLTGVNIETIRYYERIKMLPVPARTPGGHRVYGSTEARTLAFIRRARELGFALNEIRALRDLAGPGGASCAQVRKIASDHLKHIRARINDLTKLERLLARTIGKCSGTAPVCPVLDLLDARATRR
jgi:MerR family mercuric resistance operon transcriptional regulator